MTREEAIQFLDNMKHEEAGRAIGKDGFYAELMGYHVQALNIAIKALEQEPKTGHWIETADEYYKSVNEYGGGVDENTPYFTDNIGCSVCLAMFSTIDNETERFNYCPHCGAKMVEPQERSDKCSKCKYHINPDYTRCKECGAERSDKE